MNNNSRLNIKFFILVISTLCLIQSCAVNEKPISYSTDDSVLRIPESDGRHVMTDGIYQAGEWDDASKLIIDDSIQILFKQFEDHFYFSLDSKQLLFPSFDLFICSDSQNVVQLHVSAQLGERYHKIAPVFEIDSTWTWGKTSDWYANEFRWIYRMLDSLLNIDSMQYDSALIKSSFPHDAIEMQILNSKLGEKPWLFRMEIWTAHSENEPFVYPPNTTLQSLEGWSRFE